MRVALVLAAGLDKRAIWFLEGGGGIRRYISWVDSLRRDAQRHHQRKANITWL
jgi:hypothetical protein